MTSTRTPKWTAAAGEGRGLEAAEACASERWSERTFAPGAFCGVNAALQTSGLLAPRLLSRNSGSTSNPELQGTSLRGVARLPPRSLHRLRNRPGGFLVQLLMDGAEERLDGVGLVQNVLHAQARHFVGAVFLAGHAEGSA